MIRFRSNIILNFFNFDTLEEQRDENEMYIITGPPVKDDYLQDVYPITCVRNHRTFRYNEEGIEAMFRKVA